MTTLQERLRDGARIASGRGIYLDYVAIAREAADRIDALQELNAQLREQNNSVDSACAYLERQIDALEAEVAEYRKCADDAAMKHKVERDALMNDKEVLLGHMTTIRNVTNDPAIAMLTNLVLERMAKEQA